MSNGLDLSKVSDVEGRVRALSAIEEYHAISLRIDEATADLRRRMYKLQRMVDQIAQKIAEIEATFVSEYDAIRHYPDLDSPYRMHDDHLGVYCCEISGLPLRQDDETVDWGDGEALAVLARQKPTVVA